MTKAKPMKRYETMSKEELLEIICYDDSCERCPLHSKGEDCKPNGAFCGEAIRNYLEEEADPRIAKINSIEELKEAYINFKNRCEKVSCTTCEYSREKTLQYPGWGCFVNYLMGQDE